MRSRAVMMAVAAVVSLAASPVRQAASADDKVLIGVIEQQLSNPFFGALMKGSSDKAKELGVQMLTANAETPGDAATQLAAFENMLTRGVKGIQLDAANSLSLLPIVKKARDKGIFVVTTNTSLDPWNAADAAFETDNVAGGVLIGQWAKAQLGSTPARVALLDYDLTNTTAKGRHDGFLQGFGLTDASHEIAGSALTQGNVETGQQAMENLLSAHGDINVIYTINEPAASGAAVAIRKAKKTVLVTSFDGSCAGVRAVADGTIGATVMQFPQRMGQMAVGALVTAIKGGPKPEGKVNSGTVLITDKPISGLDSKDTKWGLANCWGQ